MYVSSIKKCIYTVYKFLLYLNRGRKMYEFVKSLLPKEVLDITDVNFKTKIGLK